ncbi:MFS transporter [Nocardia sp. NPDC088792]|uniref:MFS transporter n=1 Tax=Nocardia sp. NPDC088792 TaxID=3364332 RepID=UPI00382B47D8
MRPNAIGTIDQCCGRCRSWSGSGDGVGSRMRMGMSRTASFWLLAALVTLFLFSSSAPSPLYVVYQSRWNFSASTLTAVFAVYAATLLITLLIAGSLSDYVGRRPVIAAALAVNAVAAVLFLAAGGVGLLFAARALQGVAVGLVSGALSAGLIETQPAGKAGLAPLTNTAAQSGGQAIGGLGAGVLVEYGPAPTHTVYWVLLAAFGVAAIGILMMPEPGARRPGALASLRPAVTVPAGARRTFVGLLPCLVALSALSGLYLSLAPSLIVQLLNSHNRLWGGVVIFLVTGLSIGPSIGLRRIAPATMMLLGCPVMLVGVGLSAWGIAATSGVLFLVGSAVVGLGLGPSFVGVFGSLIGLAEPHTRAGMLAVIYVALYLGLGIPALAAGIAAGHIGLRVTGLAYATGVAVLIIVTIAGLLVGRRREVSVSPASVHLVPCPSGIPCLAPADLATTETAVAVQV